MVSGIKVYNVKDFVRTTQTGNIDLKRSKQLVRELVKVAGSHSDHNILIDLRETTVSVSNIVDILEVAREFGSSVSSFKNNMQGFEWEIFTDYEGAIEWLSETEDIDQTTR